MSLRHWILILFLLGTLSGCGGPYSSGDRVLVSKMAYDAGLTEPNRYEVVVFKYPGKHEHGAVRGGPLDKNTPKNYIKRLLGLPGELIAIFFGRLYHRVPEPGAPPFFDDVNENTPATELWYNSHMHTTDEDGKNVHGWDKDDKGLKIRKWFEEGKFTILRKQPHIIMALRRVVYDNDYQARDMKGKHDRWTPTKASNWKNDKATGFTHDGKSETVDWITYQHLLRPKIDPTREQDRVPAKGEIKPSLIVDSMDYNNVQIGLPGQMPHDKAALIQPYWVGDLMIECNVEVVEAKGEFWFELSKGIYRFRAKFDLATGECTLYREDTIVKKEVEELGKAATSVKSPGNYVLRLANIDARLTVWVDRALPFGDGKEYTPPEMLIKGETEWDAESAVKRRGPREENDLKRPASVGSKGARVNISHLRLWRDTYYSTSVSKVDYSMTDWLGWQEPPRWEVIRKSRFATMYVQPGHFLCLGDNSQASSDSRDWGLVPERLMLGRALVVYYPLDRMGAIR